MGGTECAHNPLAFEGMAELVDVILPIRGGGVGGQCGGGRSSLEELFDAAELCGGELGELGVVGGELGEDFFFVGGSHRDIVKVGIELVQHCVLTSR